MLVAAHSPASSGEVSLTLVCLDFTCSAHDGSVMPSQCDIGLVECLWRVMLSLGGLTE